MTMACLLQRLTHAFCLMVRPALSDASKSHQCRLAGVHLLAPAVEMPIFPSQHCPLLPLLVLQASADDPQHNQLALAFMIRTLERGCFPYSLHCLSLIFPFHI